MPKRSCARLSLQWAPSVPTELPSLSPSVFLQGTCVFLQESSWVSESGFGSGQLSPPAMEIRLAPGQIPSASWVILSSRLFLGNLALGRASGFLPAIWHVSGSSPNAPMAGWACAAPPGMLALNRCAVPFWSWGERLALLLVLPCVSPLATLLGFQCGH